MDNNPREEEDRSFNKGERERACGRFVVGATKAEGRKHSGKVGVRAVIAGNLILISVRYSFMSMEAAIFIQAIVDLKSEDC